VIEDASRLDGQRHADGHLEVLILDRMPNTAFDPSQI